MMSSGGLNDKTVHGYVSTVKKIPVDVVLVFNLGDDDGSVASPVTIALMAPFVNNERVLSGGTTISEVIIEEFIVAVN